MSPASSSAARRRRWRAGTTSLEFGAVVLLFMLVVIGCMDLGRYYIVAHSMRTLVSECVRAVLAKTTLTDCSSVYAMVPMIDTTAVTKDEFVRPGATVGISTIRVTLSYQFTAISPIWTSLSGRISETATVSY